MDARQLIWETVPRVSPVPAADQQMFTLENWGGEFRDDYPILYADFPNETVIAWGLHPTKDDPDSITALVGYEECRYGPRFALYVVCSGPETPGDFAAWRYFDSYHAAWQAACELNNTTTPDIFTASNGWETNGVKL